MLKRMDDLLIEYGKSHTHKTNRLIHKFCVPFIAFSLFGILDSIPGPISFSVLLFSFATTFYLLTKTKMKIFFLALIFMLTSLFIVMSLSMPLKIYLCGGIFIVAWIGQFIGHEIEKSRPSFIKDLLFLLVGPIWVIDEMFNSAKEI